MEKIRFILAEDLILLHCPDSEVGRELTLELLVSVIESSDLELAPRSEVLENKRSSIIRYIESL